MLLQERWCKSLGCQTVGFSRVAEHEFLALRMVVTDKYRLAHVSGQIAQVPVWVAANRGARAAASDRASTARISRWTTQQRGEAPAGHMTGKGEQGWSRGVYHWRVFAAGRHNTGGTSLTDPDAHTALPTEAKSIDRERGRLRQHVGRWALPCRRRLVGNLMDRA
jgi:hypothetical protein